MPGLNDEADDLTQEVLTAVVQHVRGFERVRAGSFRAWLRVITVNRVMTYRKARARRPVSGADPADDFLARLADPVSELSRQWDRDHDRHVLDRLLAAVQGDFEPVTWEAFRRFGLGGEPAARVAADLGLTEVAVLSAKARVLRRLRHDAAGLID